MAAKKKTEKKKATGKKLKTPSQTHGMVEKHQWSTLNQVWGDDGMARYGTLNLEKYQAEIEDLNKTDLMAHAQKLGLIPIDNVKLLKGRLTKEFRRYVSSYKKPATASDDSSEISSSAKKILEEGR
tara:strand:- start:10769 stop:11146 length:378 start_codon:yes stop_codon:yes gene_type:complete